MKTKPKSPSFLESLFFWILIWVAFYGLTGVALGNLGLFRAGPLFLVSGAASLWLTLKLAFPERVITRSDLVVWLLLPIMAGIFFPPFEYIFGGRDPGVYVAVGAGLVRTGRLRFSDPRIASLSPKDRQFFFRLRGVRNNRRLGDSYRENRQYPGLFVTHIETGEITPQFYPLYPVLLAGGYALGGIVGELMITPLITVLALVAVFLLTKEFFTREVAMVTLFLLLVNYTVVWYSRYPNSELPTTLFTFGGSWLLIKALRFKSLRLIILSGLVLGTTALLRIDSLFLIVPLLLLGLGGWSGNDQKLLRVFGPLLCLFLLANVLEGWFFSRPYFSQVILSGRPSRLAWVVALVILPGGFFFFNLANKITPLITKFEGLIRQISALSLFVFIFVWQALGLVAPSVSDLANLFKLEWYLTPPVVLIGIFGIWRVLTKRWHEAAIRFFFSYALFVLVFYLYKARVTPIHPWWVRRFVPVVVPTLLIGFAWMITEWSTKLGNFIKVFTFSFILALYLALSTLMIRFSLFQGALNLLASTAAYLPPEALVVADDDWGVLATPLFYLYGRQVTPLNPDQPVEIRSEAVNRTPLIFPNRDIWYYSLRETGKRVPLSNRFQLVGERVFVARSYQLFESLPLRQGELKTVPIKIYHHLE